MSVSRVVREPQRHLPTRRRTDHGTGGLQAIAVIAASESSCVLKVKYGAQRMSEPPAAAAM